MNVSRRRKPQPAGPKRAKQAKPAKGQHAEPDSAIFGDILGISESDPHVKLPNAPRDHGGHPRGIEVHRPGTGSVHHGSGFTSADMGGAGQGSDIEADTSILRPESD